MPTLDSYTTCWTCNVRGKTGKAEDVNLFSDLRFGVGFKSGASGEHKALPKEQHDNAGAGFFYVKKVPARS